jgi:hypothetical protein
VTTYDKRGLTHEQSDSTDERINSPYVESGFTRMQSEMDQERIGSVWSDKMMLQHQEQTEEQKTTLVPAWQEKLNSTKEAEARQVVEEIQAMGEIAVEPLLELLKTEAQTARKNRKILNGFLSGVGVLMTGAFVALGVLKGDWDPTMFVMFSFLGGGAAMAASAKQTNAIRALAQFDDIRGVGAFTEALEFQDKEVIAVAERKLMELLPRLQASDAALLDANQRAILNRTLLTGSSELVVAILKAYEQVGDSTAIANVETLSRGYKKWGELSSVAVAARACLPFLQERLRRAEQEQTLLRAANGNVTAPETLLRPAASTQETHAETLLRSADA